MNILVFKTSNGYTLNRLLNELGGERNIKCLVSSSGIKECQAKYPEVVFIDIGRESFYDLSDELVMQLRNDVFDEVYITLSGKHGYNYGNVVQLINEITFAKAFFYNCNGERISIPRKSWIKDLLIRAYISIIERTC